MTNTEIKALILLTKYPIHGYSGYAKNNFKLLGTKYLRMIAKKMGCTEKVKWNPGGIAVSGDITLHTDKFYVQFSQFCFMNKFFYRACDGIEDYTGKTNHWMDWDKLLDIDYVINCFKTVK